MKYPFPKTIGIALMTAGIALPSVGFCDVLSSGVELTATATPEGRDIHLDAATGSYVAGDFMPAIAGMKLQLKSGEQTIRELSRAAGGTQEFQFIAPDAAQLSVSGPQGGAFSLRLRTVVAPNQQHPPQAEYLSPNISALVANNDVDGFWDARTKQGTPMIEADGDMYIVTFLYRGAERNVRIFGGPGTDHEFMDHISGTNVWFRSYRLPSSTRLAYKLAPDIPDIPGTAQTRRRALVSTAAADPLNPHIWPDDAPDAYNRWSVLELPDAPPQPGYPTLQAHVTESAITSDLLGNTRRIQFFATDGYDPADPDNIMVFVFDGPRAVSDMDIPGALQRLVQQGRLPQTAAVFIDPIDSETRGKELPGNPLFAKFMAKELLPFAAAHFGTRPRAERTVVAGASYGGIGAANVAFDYPHTFGAAISMSGSYWWAPTDMVAGDLSWMSMRALDAATLPRMVITAGTFEASGSRDGVTPADIRETSRQLYAIMKARGADVSWREYAGGHDALVWRGALTDGLIRLFPSTAE